MTTDRNRSQTGLLIIIFASIILGGALLIGLLASLNSSRPAHKSSGLVTAALTVIPPLSGTSTPTAPPQPPEEIATTTPTLQPGTIGVGAFVQVSGTGGDGLRLRQGPGLENEMQFLALEGEVFQITDGPVDTDGYSWWFLVGSYDSERQGWGASNFLEIIPDS